ncbi:VOC family protein [Devosia sp. RR2S18]|uniref:VOC family protein n=1 Tax=Devosia rhizosphaerae TaxID=3049774 RepID=UPI0025410768|nr:VOC family protein [Devosia sp. RR2S18]WIJ23659.1 VOC family protein [Devosia sp. RR2S18]
MLPNQIEVITLFVNDIVGSKDFYRRIFSADIVFEDEVSAVIDLSGTMVNLLAVEEAPALVEPAGIASAKAGASMLLTVRVDDVDAVCNELAKAGVALLNGPIDRPWGRRTAAFADPSGHIWEVAQVIA